MIKAIKALKEILNFIRTLFSIVMNIFKTIGQTFNYLLSIGQTILAVLATFPSWLQAFGMITLTISIAYFMIGREAGKSD